MEAFECINVKVAKLKVQGLPAGCCTLSYNGASVTVQGCPKGDHSNESYKAVISGSAVN